MGSVQKNFSACDGEGKGEEVLNDRNICVAFLYVKKIVLRKHQVLGLCFGLVILEDVDVHFVPIEIGVEWRANTLVEFERAVLMDFHFEGHDALSVEGGLSVKQHDVTLNQVSVHDIPYLELVQKLSFDNLAFQGVNIAFLSLDGADSRILLLSIRNQVFESPHVSLGHSLWES